MRKNQKNNTPRRVHPFARVRFVFLFALLIAVGFLARLFYLQVAAGQPFQEAALAQRRRTVSITPKRGTIFDSANSPMAVSVTVNSVYFFPQEIEEKDKKETVDLLSYILHIDKEKVESAFSSSRYDVLLKTKLTQKEIDQLQSSGLRAYRVVQEAERFYPNQDIMAQCLGFVNDDGKGAYGLEAQYDALLRGKGGQMTLSRDLGGNIIPTESVERYASEEGQNVHLTMNLDAQRILSEELRRGVSDSKADAGTAILMNPNTGEILAMESYPSFNPNTPYAPAMGIGEASWKAMTEEERLSQLYTRWKNPAVSTLYEPGSVFKTLTASIALETKSSLPESHYLCTGKIELSPGVWIRCWRHDDPHGSQTLEEALNHSCNPAFVQIVRDIGKENFYSYLRSLRMGQITGVDLPGEQASLFPDTMEKLEIVRMQTMSYGHGISITPLEMMAAVNTVINGGYYRTPHLFSFSSAQDGKVLSQFRESVTDPIFSEETVETMRRYMLSTTKASNAKVLRIKDVAIGSKSGTTLLLEDGEYSDKTIASLYSFLPAEKPEIALFVVIHSPKINTFGGEVAGEVSAKILERFLPLKKDPQQKKEGQTVPDVCGKTVEEARALLQKAGFSLSVYGAMNDYTLVDRQIPSAGTVQPQKSVVECRPDDSARFRVPSLVGMSTEEAKQILRQANIAFSFIETDRGKIIDQDPAAGTVVDKETALVLSADPTTEASSAEEQGSSSSADADESAGQ